MSGVYVSNTSYKIILLVGVVFGTTRCKTGEDIFK